MAGEGEKGGGGNGKRDPIGPIPVPETDAHLELIDQSICDCWEALGQANNKAQLRACVAETLHPDVPWPPIPGDDQTVHAMWELFSQRVDGFLAAADKQAWCAGLGGPDPLDILEELVHLSPTGGGFYLVGSDPELGNAKDSLSNVVRRALNGAVPGAGSNPNMRKEYMHCVTMGSKWNLPNYGSSSFSQNFPSWAGVNGVGLRRAFYPYHDDAKKAVLQRRMPKRGITQAGAKLPGVGNKFALLWLPPIDAETIESQQIVTCGTFGWADGTSSIDPPPEFFALFNGGA